MGKTTNVIGPKAQTCSKCNINLWLSSTRKSYLIFGFLGGGKWVEIKQYSWPPIMYKIVIFGEAKIWNLFLAVKVPLFSILTLLVHYAHAAANLNSGYSKYAKVGRMHYFCTITLRTSPVLMRAWASHRVDLYVSVGLIYFLNG